MIYEDNKPVIVIELANRGVVQEQIVSIAINDEILNVTYLPSIREIL